MSPLEKLNSLGIEEFKSLLIKCCGSKKFVNRVSEQRPFSSDKALFQAAEKSWTDLHEEDILEAMTHHPRIGSVSELEKKFGATAQWSLGEQSEASKAPATVLDDLKVENDRYFEKFGFIFLVCATGKSAQEMLEMLRKRFPLSRKEELENARKEQGKITRLRLQKLLQEIQP